MAGLQVTQQLLLVGFAEGVGRGGLGHPGAAKLLKQRVRRFLEFGGKLGDGGT